MKFSILLFIATSVLAGDINPAHKPQDIVECSTAEIEDTKNSLRVQQCSTRGPCFDEENNPQDALCKTTGERCGEW